MTFDSLGYLLTSGVGEGSVSMGSIEKIGRGGRSLHSTFLTLIIRGGVGGGGGGVMLVINNQLLKISEREINVFVFVTVICKSFAVL